MTAPTVRMWTPAGVRVDSVTLTGTSRASGLVRGGPRLRDGNWLIIAAPSGVFLAAVDADGPPASTLAGLARVASELAPRWAFDPADLTDTPPEAAPDAA